MATATASSYSVLTLGEAGGSRGRARVRARRPDRSRHGRRGRVYVRRDLDINSFGVNAFYQAESGALVIGEHEEVGPGASGHEELYVVVEGGATFTVDGEEVDAPRGTAVFVRTRHEALGARDRGRHDRARRRRQARRGVEPEPRRVDGRLLGLYRDKDYEGALAMLRSALEAHPGNALILYNIACMEACLGHGEAALRAARRIGRRVAEVQAAGRRGRGLRRAARRPALPGARRRGGVSVRR